MSSHDNRSGRHIRSFEIAWSLKACDPPGKSGTSAVLELRCIDDFFRSHEPQVPATVESQAGRIQLRKLEPDCETPQLDEEHLRIVSSGTANHYIADFSLDAGQNGPLHLRFRVVARHKQGYVFLAGYLGNRDGPGRCYLVETHEIDPAVGITTQLEKILRREVRKIINGQRRKDHWGIGPPLLKRRVSELASGAVRREMQFPSGKELIQLDPTLIRELCEKDLRSVRSFLSKFSKSVSTARGRSKGIDRIWMITVVENSFISSLP